MPPAIAAMLGARGWLLAAVGVVVAVVAGCDVFALVWVCVL